MLPLRILALLALVALLPFSLTAAEGPKRVLLIHSFGRDFAPFHELASEFRTSLARQNPQPIEFLEVSLELSRFDGVDREQPLLDFLAAVFDSSKPDLLVPIGGPAALFCARHRDTHFKQVRLLVVGVDQRRLEGVDLGPESVAVTLQLDTRALVRNILDLLPSTQRIYVVMGSGPLEQFWEEELRREWSGLAAPLTFHWLSDQSLDLLRATVSQLPPQSAVFYGIVSRDGAGVPHEIDSALTTLHQVANAPIFGYGSQQLGLGIVGGRLLPLKRTGTVAAAAALRFLTGESAASIRPDAIELDPPAYDARELRRWKIPSSALPSGSLVLFTTPTLWEAHRDFVLGVLGIATVQSALILLLLAARRRAREAHASLSLAAEAASVGLWERNLLTNEIKASPRWRELIGLPPKGPVSLAHLLRQTHPEDVPRLRQSLEQAALDGGRYEVEFRVITSDGQVRWVHSLGRAEPESGRPRLRTRGASLDITRRKQTEAEVARQRNELAHLSRVASLGVLSGSLAHELSQPLGIVLANSQAAQRLLQRHPADLVELQAILADIVSEVRRAGEFIHRLRSLLRRGETHWQIVDINECIDEVLRLLRGDLVSRAMPVRRETSEAPSKILGDRVHLQQILLNLITNACDAMETTSPEERLLTLTTTRDEARLQISVCDSGSGLPADPELLFQPYHTTKPHGLGMGLAICRTLVHAHRGRIWAEANPHKGASFHISLPLSP